MAIIKIEDLPTDKEITQEEMKAVMGGGADPQTFRNWSMKPIWPHSERLLIPAIREGLPIPLP